VRHVNAHASAWVSHAGGGLSMAGGTAAGDGVPEVVMQVLPRAEGNRPTYSTTPARRIGARAREPLAGSMVNLSRPVLASALPAWAFWTALVLPLGSPRYLERAARAHAGTLGRRPPNPFTAPAASPVDRTHQAAPEGLAGGYSGSSSSRHPVPLVRQWRRRRPRVVSDPSGTLRQSLRSVAS
jgi:hypothetical protein